MGREEEIRQERLKKIEKLEQEGVNPYPVLTTRDFSILDALDNFEELSESKKEITLAGRVMAKRGQGAIVFINIFDGTEKIQALFKKDEMSEERFSLFKEVIDIGDFIEVKGSLFITQRGEKTLQVIDWGILTKSLLPLPEKWHGLTDDELRFRKRYLDILMNENLRKMIKTKARFWQYCRQFLSERGFIEVETPTLELTTGGAEATPFSTHHDDFDLDVYLRISVGELWQKRLMAAGLDKTFEIGRVYRNEGSSPEHLQEFTNLEFYASFLNFEDGKKLIQDLYRSLANNVFNKTTFEVKDYKFDLDDEWKELDYVKTIEEMTGVNVLEATVEDLKNKLNELGVVYEGANKERLMDSLWKYCRKQVSGPAFLINHPKEVAPLSKTHPDDPRLTKTFQVILAGSEIGRAHAELNNPLEQKKRFEDQQKLLEGGDTEAMMPDFEYVEMLEHGMPPVFGFGFGERLFSYLWGENIRETQTFPLMKPKDTENKKDKTTKMVSIVLNKSVNLEKWQEMNTVGHLSSAFGARIKNGEQLFKLQSVSTLDDFDIPLNIKHAVMIKYAKQTDDIYNLIKQADGSDLHYEVFTREMLETTNDNKVKENTKNKRFDEVEILGCLVFGEKKKVDEITEGFDLIK